MISRRAIGVDDAARDAADAVHELLARAGDIGTRPDLRAAIDALTVDQDGDLFTECGGDCTDADATLWGVPGEVQGFRFPSRTTVAWTPPASPGSSAASRYQLARSSAKAMTAPECLLPDSWPGEHATDV